MRQGLLSEGKQADFIAVDLNYPSMQPVYTYPMRNIVPNLVYSARGCEVALSAVNGRVIMKDQRILTIDEDACIRNIQKYPHEIGRKSIKRILRYTRNQRAFYGRRKTLTKTYPPYINGQMTNKSVPPVKRVVRTRAISPRC